MRMWDVGYLAWLGGIMLLGVALRLAGLTVHSLWFDEGCTIINSSFDSIANLWRNVIALEGGSERYQPLNIILLWCWRRMFGSSETILRLFPAVLGILSLPVFYWSALRIFKRRGALFALALFSFSAFAVYYAQEIRPYSLMILLAVCHIGCFLFAAKRQTVGSSFLLAAASAAAFFGSVFSALFIASLALGDWLWNLKRSRRVILRWLPSVLACLPILFFYLSSPDVDGGTAGAKVPDLQQPVWQNALFSVYGVLAGTTFGPSIESLRSHGASALQAAWLTIGLLAASVAALSLVLLHRMTRASDADQPAFPSIRILLSAAVIMFVAQTAFAVVMDFNWQPRHTYWLLPVVALALGWAASTSRTAAGWALLLIGLNLYSLSNYWFEPSHRKDEIRELSRYLTGVEGPVYNASTSTLLPMYEYYGLERAEQLAISDGNLRLALKSRSASAGWVINYRPYYSRWKDSEALARAIAPDHAVLGKWEFKGIDLYKIGAP
jgi:uncharacterized membrane protein